MVKTVLANEMTFRYIGRFGVMYCLSGNTKSTHRLSVIWNGVVVAKVFRVRQEVAKPVSLDVVELA